MNKFIPFEKMSKRKKQEVLAKKRRTWGPISPVTRKPDNPKAYKRRKARKWNDDSSAGVFFTADNKDRDGKPGIEKPAFSR